MIRNKNTWIVVAALVTVSAPLYWAASPLFVDRRVSEPAPAQISSGRARLVRTGQMVGLDHVHLGSVQRDRRTGTTADPGVLAADERSVTEIAGCVGLGQPATSKHLRVLSEVGLVTAPGVVRRSGHDAELDADA